MKIIEGLKQFLIIFALIFIVTLPVAYLYQLIAHGTGVWDFDLAFQNAVIFGIILTLIDRFKKD